MVEAGSTNSDADDKKNEGRDDETIEFEIIFGPNAVIKPFAVMIKKFHASSTPFTVEAVII